jgi:(2Fe-2S) ferredoxin
MSKNHNARESEGKQGRKKEITQAAYTVFCCQGSDCSKRGAQRNLKTMKAQVREAGMKGDVAFIETECMDQCKHGPMVIVCSRGQDSESGPVWYCKVRSKDAAIIVYQHLQHNEVLHEKRFRQREPVEASALYTELNTENEEADDSQP